MKVILAIQNVARFHYINYPLKVLEHNNSKITLLFNVKISRALAGLNLPRKHLNAALKNDKNKNPYGKHLLSEGLTLLVESQSTHFTNEHLTSYNI